MYTLDDVISVINSEKAHASGLFACVDEITNETYEEIMKFCARKLEVNISDEEVSKVINNKIRFRKRARYSHITGRIKLLKDTYDDVKRMVIAAHEFTHYLLCNHVYTRKQLRKITKEVSEGIAYTMELEMLYELSQPDRVNRRIKGLQRVFSSGAYLSYYLTGFAKTKLLQKENKSLREIATTNFNEIILP